VTPRLSVRELGFAYERMPVLFDVSFDVEPGGALALVGTNGAGKSTLLRVIAGLESPTRGRVELDGTDITGLRAEQLVRRGLVLVQGGRAPFPDLTVADNLEIQGLTVRHRPEWVAIRRELVLDTFPALKRHWSQVAGRMSGGEQQQLVLAKALLIDPALLCIDELSLGLAPIVVQTLLECVRSLRAAGTTLIIVEQSLNVAAELCEQAVFLEKGHVRFQGRTGELLESEEIARAVFLGGVAPRNGKTAEQGNVAVDRRP
jgi:ABC-type branched-subunit amino acid transport system ATPase component